MAILAVSACFRLVCSCLGIGAWARLGQMQHIPSHGAPSALLRRIQAFPQGKIRGSDPDCGVAPPLERLGFVHVYIVRKYMKHLQCFQRLTKWAHREARLSVPAKTRKSACTALIGPSNEPILTPSSTLVRSLCPVVSLPPSLRRCFQGHDTDTSRWRALGLLTGHGHTIRTQPVGARATGCATLRPWPRETRMEPGAFGSVSGRSRISTRSGRISACSGRAAAR